MAALGGRILHGRRSRTLPATLRLGPLSAVGAPVCGPSLGFGPMCRSPWGPY